MVDKQEYEITQQEKELAEDLIAQIRNRAIVRRGMFDAADRDGALMDTWVVQLTASLAALTARAEQAGREPDCDTRVRDAIYLEAYASSELGGQTAHCARFEQIAQHLRGIRPDARITTLTQAKEAAEAALRVKEAEIAEALKVLDPNMPESGLVDACKQVKQVAISEADNSTHIEAALARLTAYVQHKPECEAFSAGWVENPEARVYRIGDGTVREYVDQPVQISNYVVRAAVCTCGLASAPAAQAGRTPQKELHRTLTNVPVEVYWLDAEMQRHNLTEVERWVNRLGVKMLIEVQSPSGEQAPCGLDTPAKEPQ